MANVASNDEQYNDALTEFGLTPDQITEFSAGKIVVFEFPTSSNDGVAVVAKGDGRLRLGIIMIHDPGAGIKSILMLKQRAEKLAATFAYEWLEVFGAAFSNRRFESLLRRRGYIESEENCPDELGGGTMRILAKIEHVPEVLE